MRKLLIIIFVTVSLSLLFPWDTFCAGANYIDVHIHLDPMSLQRPASFARGPRGPRRFSGREGVDYEGMATNIISLMDKMSVEKAILMPPPQVPNQRGMKATYATCVSVAKYYPDRIIVGGGGDTLNRLIYKYAKDEVTPEIEAQFRLEAEKLLREGAFVFGEMSALHLSMQEHHIFSQVDPDHPLFLLLTDIAAENNIPIDFHMEPVPQDMPMPESLLKISSFNPAMLKANISGLERLLKHNRKAKIVWQHIGWDNIGYMTIELLWYLLGKHPNLYLALRVESRQMKMDNSNFMPNRIVDSNWNIRPEWRQFIIDFSERIVIGSDDFMGVLRQQPRPKDSFRETWGILWQLPEEIAYKIGRGNAVRIYNLGTVAK